MHCPHCWVDAGWMLVGCWMDAGLCPRISWMSSACSLCIGAGADLGMLHPGAAPCKRGRNPPCCTCCPAVIPGECSKTHLGYSTLSWGLGASRLTQGRSSFSICSDPAQQFLCCCLLPELRGSGGTVVRKELGTTMPQVVRGVNEKVTDKPISKNPEVKCDLQ